MFVCLRRNPQVDQCVVWRRSMGGGVVKCALDGFVFWVSKVRKKTVLPFGQKRFSAGNLFTLKPLVYVFHPTHIRPSFAL